jgi:2-dehydro-3-deoxyphosphogluconate aldolase / (4S)-4-hydroxy-2-oxoglutarate aldolase
MQDVDAAHFLCNGKNRTPSRSRIHSPVPPSNSHSFHAIAKVAPVVAIIRRPKVDPIRCVEMLFEAGIRLVEITIDTSGAIDLIKSLKSAVPSDGLLGAGTVTDLKRLDAALVAGASFVVTPSLNLDVIRTCREHGVPIVPGAMTPTEIYSAAAAGADYVKVFPASALGPAFFRELRGPFAEIPLVATGGVNLENARDFIRCGADALGVGGALIPKSNSELSQCGETARELLRIVHEARKSWDSRL